MTETDRLFRAESLFFTKNAAIFTERLERGVAGNVQVDIKAAAHIPAMTRKRSTPKEPRCPAADIHAGGEHSAKHRIINAWRDALNRSSRRGMRRLLDRDRLSEHLEQRQQLQVAS